MSDKNEQHVAESQFVALQIDAPGTNMACQALRWHKFAARSFFWCERSIALVCGVGGENAMTTSPHEISVVSVLVAGNVLWPS